MSQVEHNTPTTKTTKKEHSDNEDKNNKDNERGATLAGLFYVTGLWKVLCKNHVQKATLSGVFFVKVTIVLPF